MNIVSIAWPAVFSIFFAGFTRTMKEIFRFHHRMGDGSGYPADAIAGR